MDVWNLGVVADEAQERAAIHTGRQRAPGSGNHRVLANGRALKTMGL